MNYLVYINIFCFGKIYVINQCYLWKWPNQNEIRHPIKVYEIWIWRGLNLLRATSTWSCYCFSCCWIAEFRWIIFVDQYWWSSMSMLSFLKPAGFLNAVKLFKKSLNLLMKTKPNLVWYTSTYQKCPINYSKNTSVCFIM